MTEQEKKIESEIENCGSKENQKISEKQENENEEKFVICNSRCSICNSDHVREIHDLKKSGKQLNEIVEEIEKSQSFKISIASLSRHFSKYRERQQIMAAQILEGDLVEGATKQAIHTQEIVTLIDAAISQIKQKIASGNINFGVDDLDKLMKMRYQVLKGETDDTGDLMKVFNRAQTIFNQNQLHMNL